LRRSGSFAGIYNFAALHCHHAAVNAKIVQYFAVVLHIEDCQVRVFANFDGADVRVAARGARITPRLAGVSMVESVIAPFLALILSHEEV